MEVNRRPASAATNAGRAAAGPKVLLLVRGRTAASAGREAPLFLILFEPPLVSNGRAVDAASAGGGRGEPPATV